MHLTKELLLSIVSIFMGALGTYVGVSKFQSDARDRLFNERKALILAEENVRVLRRDLDDVIVKMQLMLEKMDIRCDQLERNQIKLQGMMQALLTQKGER